KMLASKMSQDEEFLKNIQDEKVQFKLTDPSSTHKTTGSIKADTASILTPEHRPYVKESGVVTERLVTQLVQDDRPLIIHPKVVVTPLAKEMIRSKRLLLEVLE